MAARRGPVDGIAAFGRMSVRSAGALLHVVWRIVRGVLRMAGYTLGQIGRMFAFLGHGIAGAFRERNAASQALLDEIEAARREGGGAARPVLRLLREAVFGEHGLLRTGFNYILPVVSVFFLAAILHYGAGLDYAISVAVNGQEIGIVQSEQEFEAAEAEAIARISAAGEDADIRFDPVYTLRIVSENDQYITTHRIADRLLESSHNELDEAWGVYVDGTFIGAVRNKDAVSDEMDKALAEYAVGLDELANEVYYTREITYEEGIYLTASIAEPADLLEILTAQKELTGTYVTEEGDTPQLIAAKFGMTREELIERNPLLRRTFRAGMTLEIVTRERYIPIAYTKQMTVTSFIDYTTVRVDTSALNLGVEKILSKGVLGKRTSDVLVTYVDGTEQSREILHTAITKPPVPEQIGVGTYSPEPASETTVLLGNGMFGWPVNGGYISSPFGGARNHKGLDIAAPYKTEIYAAGNGTVVTAGWNSGGYGNYVIIEHENGYRTLYAHCCLVIAVEGQQVEKGQLIAYVGSTGDSTGNHCHFEVRFNNICNNPANYLRVNAD
ncbi:MAG: M23 family metallopeptidase [Oscillospiraceae bacterium]|nr:M23 family metallopeptidase [Oscillospiraceae bacterium]